MATTTLPSLSGLLAATVERYGHQPALTSVSETGLEWWTWSDLASKVDDQAAKLRQLGVEPGDRVVQVGPNSVEWVVNDLALLAIDGVHVPLHTSLPEVQQQEQIEHSGARWLLGPQGRAERLPESPNSSLPSPEGLATILYTSGTTGHPRGVMLSHANLAANAVATCDAFDNDTQELRLLVLPLSHIYARTCDLYCWVYRGSRLVVGRGRAHFLDDCQRVRPTVINAVPYLYQKLVDGASASPGGSLRELLGGHIRQCFSGGAALAPALMLRFREEGIPLLPGYGLTETSPVVTVSTIADHAPGTVGRVLSNVEVQLAEDGEIVMRGPSVMLGYWRDPKATAAVMDDGWFHSGDLGEWDEAGRLKIVGRKKELIALSTGKKVSPSEVESLLTSSPMIEQAMVMGDGQSHIAALVVPNPTALRAEIKRHRLWVWSKRRAVTHPKVVEIYRQEIARVLADQPTSHQIREFAILTRGFSIERGELTAKLSLRRNIIESTFANELHRLFT